MLGYLSLDNNSSVPRSEQFSESEAGGKLFASRNRWIIVQGQISEHIFAPNEGYLFILPGQECWGLNTRVEIGCITLSGGRDKGRNFGKLFICTLTYLREYHSRHEARSHWGTIYSRIVVKEEASRKECTSL